MDAREPWLSDRQQRVWRRWLRMNAALPSTLHRALQSDSGLSLPDFEVLVHLSEATGERARVTDLAAAMSWERSRLSHHLTRMESRRLVTRQECQEDGRGAFVVLTADGRAAIESAAPCHARTVRDVIFDPLTDEELDCLEAITDKVLGRLQARS